MRKKIMCFLFLLINIFACANFAFAQQNLNLQDLWMHIPPNALNILNDFEPVVNQIMNSANSGDTDRVINTTQDVLNQKFPNAIPMDVQNQVKNNVKNIIKSGNSNDPQQYLDIIKSILAKKTSSNDFTTSNTQTPTQIPTQEQYTPPTRNLNNVFKNNDYNSSQVEVYIPDKKIYTTVNVQNKPKNKPITRPVTTPVATVATDPNEGKSARLTDLVSCNNIGAFSASNYFFAKGISISSKKEIILIYPKSYVQKAIDAQFGAFAPNVNSLPISTIKENMVGNCYRTNNIKKIENVTCDSKTISANIYLPTTYIPDSSFGDCSTVLK